MTTRPDSTPDGPGGTPPWAALRRLLDLLAEGAPPDDFTAVAEDHAGDGPGARAAIAEATRTALRIRRTLSQHRRREAELAALFDTAGDLAALRDLDAVLRAITHRAKLLLGTDVTYLSLNDEEAGDTYMRVTDGCVSAAFQRVRLGMGEGLGGLVAETARPYTTGDYRDDPRFRHTATIDHAVADEGLRAILGVPLRVGARIIGVLYAADRSARAFGPDEVALLSSLADHAAIAIDSTRLMDETRSALVDLNLASRTIEAHSEAMQRAEEAHDRLTDLVLRGGDVTDVASDIGTILQAGVVIHDADGGELACVGTEFRPPPAEALTASRTGGRAVPVEGADGTAGAWVCAVLAGHEPLGSILLTGRGDLGDADRRLFERASVVTALLLLLRRSVAETEDRVRGELLGDLLARGVDAGAVTSRARRMGLDLGAPHAVFVLHAETAETAETAGATATGTVTRQRLLASAVRAARARGGLAGAHQDEVVLVLPSGAPSSRAAALADELSQSLGTPVTVGAAGPAAGPDTFADVHLEARRCLTALRALGRTGTGAALADLGFVGVLLGDRADLTGYVRRTLGPLIDYDARRGTDLLGTLRAYFACGMNQSRAKDDLHVHINTVVQRLDRVGQLLGDGWQHPDRALELQLALRLAQVSPGAD